MKQIIALMAGMFIVTVSTGQENQVPENYKPNDEVVYGDLDNDGINERVIVYDIITPENENNGIDREIIIYKKQKENWKIWHRSKNAVKNSTEGGAFGDPFEGIEISKGVLLIYHYGGSSSRWSHTDKYRFQNNRFELIGYTDYSGQPCNEWLGFDFNVITGKIVVINEFEKCDETEKSNIKHVVYKKKNETFTHRLLETLTLENRYKNSETNPVIITSPKYKHELYLKY